MTFDTPQTLVLTLSLMLFFQAPAIAGLDGAQRKSVYGSTYKSCLLSASKSAPQVPKVEQQAWCACYAEQVVDHVAPTDIQNYSPTSGPSSKMISVANDAVAYCRKKSY